MNSSLRVDQLVQAGMITQRVDLMNSSHRPDRNRLPFKAELESSFETVP